ncbi:MAG: ferritin-like domain-containing protein [Ferruginibacter sp.]|nr:ferritin-like domain-containing protein [Ferruginibacter sp.]
MGNKKSFPLNIPEEDTIPETDVSKEFLNFLLDQLKDIYWAEKHLTKSLPKMQKAATTKGLKDAFTFHLATTQVHVERLEQVFELLGETPRAKKSEAMTGLIDDVNSIIEETKKGSDLRDAGLVLAAQKAEHYEIAAYGGLVQLARTMGNEDIISLLEQTLLEEKKTDEFLTMLAETGISSLAKKEGMDLSTEVAEEAAAVYDSVNLTRKNVKKV